MPDSYLELSYWQVAAAALLIAVNGAVSLCLRLGLERQLAIASIRMTAQLILVGLVLRWVFALNVAYAVVSLMVLMTLIAGVSAVERTKSRYPGIWVSSIISVWASSWLVGGIALFGIIDVEPWYRPRYAVPLLGMILGNTLSGISLGLDRFSSELDVRRDEIETYLALGATRWEAASSPAREAVRTAMIPTLNAMMVTGIVSLPGMMTGQLVSGIDPTQAVRYQLVIMFLIAAGTALGSVAVVLLSFRFLFDAWHRLRLPPHCSTEGGRDTSPPDPLATNSYSGSSAVRL
jgi:putative ABC transport system permease protein